MPEIKYAAIMDHIERQWDDLTRSSRDGSHERLLDWRHLAANSDDGHLDDVDSKAPHILYLPHPFVAPGGRFPVQFYWDSYFIIECLVGSDRHALAKGMVDNALFLVERHGMVVANRKRWSAGSQLPFLSHMVRAVYREDPDNDWLLHALGLIEQEYLGYWLDSAHLSHAGLSRYHAPPWFPPTSIAAITMDNEATWDLSPRFSHDTVLNLLPVDLNSNLRAYEDDLAALYAAVGDEPSAAKWRESSRLRGETLDELLWDAERGLYLDFNFKYLQASPILSLATFFPLFFGHASALQAQAVAGNLALFEAEHGLKTCDRTYGYRDRQWNAPLGWAPLHYIAVKGLRRYGFHDDAYRIAKKWLDLNLQVFERTGHLFEKYDVVTGTHDVLTDRYSNQRGFGWTNAVFVMLTREFELS